MYTSFGPPLAVYKKMNATNPGVRSRGIVNLEGAVGMFFILSMITSALILSTRALHFHTARLGRASLLTIQLLIILLIWSVAIAICICLGVWMAGTYE